MTGDPAMDLLLAKALDLAGQPIVGNHPLVAARGRHLRRIQEALVTHQVPDAATRADMEKESWALQRAMEELRATLRGPELLR